MAQKYFKYSLVFISHVSGRRKLNICETNICLIFVMLPAADSVCLGSGRREENKLDISITSLKVNFITLNINKYPDIWDRKAKTFERNREIFNDSSIRART